jgi:hypothetical protein
MEAVKTNGQNEVTTQIEELEAKIAPDAGSSASFLD